MPGRQFTRDFFLEVAKGNIPGHSFVLKFGENLDIDTGGFEDVWDVGGPYVPPTQARTHDLASTSANDTGTVLTSGTATGGSANTIEDSGATFTGDGISAGDAILNDTNTLLATVISVDSDTQITVVSWRGPNNGLIGDPIESGDNYRIVTNASTGASFIWIVGQNATRNEIMEFVVLNGVNNVATANTYVRQYRARTFGPVTTGTVGTVTSTAQTDGTISLQIVNGNNQTQMAIYTVPIDKTGYIVKWWGTMSKGVGSSAASVVRLRGGTLDGLGYLLQSRAALTDGNSAFDYDYAVPSPIPGGIDIWVEADASANDTGIASGFDIILVDN